MKPFVLVILDGYAHNPDQRGNAVFHARKPALDRLFATSPLTELQTFGERVGLPDDQMGNSEVGHLNIGAGRVVEQELTRINRAVRGRHLAEISALRTLFSSLRTSADAALHLIGLLSKGGVHSSMAHAAAIISEAASQGVRHVYVHAITDGRDRPPAAAIEDLPPFLESLHELERTHGGEYRIASLVGRFFAMDRDSRWERTEKAYNLFTLGHGETVGDTLEAVRRWSATGGTDEFLEPCAVSGRPTVVRDGDAVLFFNFRADRMRQIVHCFLPNSQLPFSRAIRLSGLLTLTEYEADLPVQVLFPPITIQNHLGGVLAAAGLRQLRIAETEKYAHVTYFFNGGEESPVRNEERILIPSPRDVPTYDRKPEMSAVEVTDRLLAELSRFDAVILNYANCDMVGHTGNFAAAVSAVETVDTCVGRLLGALQLRQGSAIITADHGNADQMIEYDTGAPHTYHTKHPVPFAVFGEMFHSLRLRPGGALCDIAPTICELLALPQPIEMTGQSLIVGPSATIASAGR